MPQTIVCRLRQPGVASPDNLHGEPKSNEGCPSGKVDMKDYVLNKKPEPASNEMVWAFDFEHPLRLERGEDRGEVSNPGNQKTAVNTTPRILHKASLLIPADLAETKTAAARNLLE